MFLLAMINLFRLPKRCKLLDYSYKVLNTQADLFIVRDKNYDKLLS